MTKWPLRVALASRTGHLPAWQPGKRWFSAPQAVWLRGPLMKHVDSWLKEPHPLWDSIIDRPQLHRFQSMWQLRKPSYSWDDQVFKMVSLDRFLHTWVAK